MWKLLPALAVLMAASGAVADPLGPMDCREWLQGKQQALDEAGIRDAGGVRLEHHPHLRINRWLARLRDRVDGPDARQQWLALAGDKALRGWRAELERLHAPEPAPLERLEHCVETLVEVTGYRGVPDREVPDHYSPWLRTLGVYPVTRWLATPFIRNYHRDMTERMEAAEAAEPAARYRLAEHDKGRRPPRPEAFTGNPLEIPLPPPAATRALLHHYAPEVLTGEDDEDNRPGRVYLRDGEPAVDTTEPLLYHWLSHTEFDGRALLQLNYQFWFPRRPPQQRPDLYAGTLDSVIWRVTLRPDGRVLFYDSIHSCGCYHKVFPVAEGLEKDDIPGDRPVFSPHPAPDARDTPVELLLEPDTHYLLRAREASPGESELPVRKFRPRHTDVLRRLPRDRDDPDAGVTSLYDDRGLIPASRRLERWVLWPMGIRSAGAMRQPGTHAIAFIGRRHFDDPDLPEILFRTGEGDLW